ncbi:uncharacterized protein [Triticum aestivum]|uniref:uncharacterized protein isoform X1 n=1 Tax=Triticum aestivum TaxID=4565 RepID=UPI001D0143FF|nr:uncharacterized protein LOC123111342 isoform X1 [Triticum aestivum]
MMMMILSPRQWLLLLPLVFLSTLLFSYLYTTLWLRPERLRQKLRSQGVKGPKPSFLFGNIPEMRRIQKLATPAQEEGAGPTDRFSSNYVATLFPYFLHWTRVYGSIYLYATGSIQTLHVIHPDMVKELASCKSLDLGKPSYLQKEHGALLGTGILTANGDLWVHQRKVIAPEFFMDKVKGMVNLMMDAALSMLNSWEEKVESEGGRAEIVVDEFLRNFSADVISRASFGSSFVEGKEIFYKIRQLQKAMAKRSMLIGVPGSSSPSRPRAVAGRPQIPSPPTPPLVLLLPRGRPRARPGKALPSPAAAGTRCPPAREELARAGALGQERGVRPDVTAGAGGAPAIPYPMAGDFKIWDATVARDGGVVTRSAAARPDLGPGVSLVSGSRSARWQVRHVGSWTDLWDSILEWSLTTRATPGETLDLHGIERWRCFCVIVPLQGIVLEFATVEGTSEAGSICPVAQLLMKIAPTMVMADDGGVFDVVSLSRHRRCSWRHQTRGAPGETLDLGLPDWTMMAFLVSLSLVGASFWSK